MKTHPECPECSRPMMPVSITTGPSGDGDYTYADGFQCEPCNVCYVYEEKLGLFEVVEPYSGVRQR